MVLDGLGSSQVSRQFPSDVGAAGAVGSPAPLDSGLFDDAAAPAVGFSGVSEFEGAAPIARQAPELRGATPAGGEAVQGASALSALSGRSDFEANRVEQAAGEAPRASARTQEFLRQALSQNGNRYVFGAEASPSNANPAALDCSELVEWAAARAGVRFPDGSANQIDAARPMPVEQALRTPGALLYRPGHIAISLGDGRTIEARNRNAGVGIFDANNRGWTRAGTIPGME
ncbi:MAG: NlpC/P60 family protein [Myxococcaceae bacterium]|nr:NlpC/P60 family protein [Myxococcaceae bacterium]